ncbi:fimbrial protein [Franconibacter pulveris]
MIHYIFKMVKTSLLFIVVSISGVTLCYAYCDDNKYGGPYNHYIDFGEVRVTSSTEVGSVLGSVTVIPSNVQIGGCHAGTIPFGGVYTGAYTVPVSSMPNIYATNVPGVGIRAYVMSGQVSGFYFGRADGYVQYAPEDHGLYDTETVRFDLIKTGNIAAGTLSTGLMSRLLADNVAYAAYTLTGGSISVSSCSVLTPSVSTALGNYLTTDFTGVNSATASIHVPVKLDCPASNMHIQVRVNATADTSTTQPGAIRLDAGSPLTATGVAIQMVDKNDNGLPINQDWSETTGEAGKVNLGLHARYLQTGPVVTAGDANASATLTLNYE